MNKYRKIIIPVIMSAVLTAFSLSACGKNKDSISTDNSQKLQSESSQEYDNGRDTQMIPAGELQTTGDLQTTGVSQPTGESQMTGENKNVQGNASGSQDNNINSELPPVSIIPESSAASSEAADKNNSRTDNTSGTDSTGSGNDKNEDRKTDPIELPFVPAY